MAQEPGDSHRCLLGGAGEVDRLRDSSLKFRRLPPSLSFLSLFLLFPSRVLDSRERERGLEPPKIVPTVEAGLEWASSISTLSFTFPLIFPSLFASNGVLDCGWGAGGWGLEP